MENLEENQPRKSSLVLVSVVQTVAWAAVAIALALLGKHTTFSPLLTEWGTELLAGSTKELSIRIAIYTLGLFVGFLIIGAAFRHFRRS